MTQDSLPPPVRLKLDELVGQYDRLDAQLLDPEVMHDHRRVRELAMQKAVLEPVVRGYRHYRALITEAEGLRQTVASGDDPELAELAREELPVLEARAAEEIARVKSRLVTAEDDRVGSVILEVRAGTGGDEATLWARDLIEIYTRYAAKRGWKVEVLELTGEPSVGGVRHAVLSVGGEAVWTQLGFEAGVHSVKRVPATEAQGRIHTSTATVAVLPEPQEIEVRIDWEKDVREDLTTAQGPGGQNVNKVVTACKLLHLPTGIEVRMQESKSLQQNREKARRLLLARLFELERRKAEAARAAERREQIGSGERSEKIRVYRYQDGIVADQRLEEKFALRDVLAGELGPLFAALIEQETNRRLAAL
ncbi:MAG: PCRF domain-containing protein [Phycisphaeraceae bacterium]|nr:PCRF domain-containing protein [Phycisphaeraceae bacterium]MCW5754382.1 PCRF domain-containing protein [Phycisphaeraceae bacterium]